MIWGIREGRLRGTAIMKEDEASLQDVFSMESEVCLYDLIGCLARVPEFVNATTFTYCMLVAHVQEGLTLGCNFLDNLPSPVNSRKLR